MPHLDHTGPEDKGPKTGRKLGKCRKTETELKEIGKLGKGQGKRHHSGGGKGKGKRLKYNQNV
ncbi:MAG: DUF5320 family protein [Bacteroidota bacterium]